MTNLVKVWREVLRASRKGFDSIYEKLGVKVTEKGESAYADNLEEVVSELKQKGMRVKLTANNCIGILKRSEGAWVVFTNIGTSPLMVQTSDGIAIC